MESLAPGGSPGGQTAALDPPDMPGTDVPEGWGPPWARAHPRRAQGGEGTPRGGETPPHANNNNNKRDNNNNNEKR